MGKLSSLVVGRSFEELERARGIVDMLRDLAGRSDLCAHALAHGLVRLAVTQLSAGLTQDALDTLADVEEVCARSGRARTTVAGTLAGATFVRATALAKLGRTGEALHVAEEHVGRVQELARRDATGEEFRLAWALRLHAHCLAAADRFADAATTGVRAARLGRRLLARGHEFDLATLLVALGEWWYRMSQHDEAAAFTEEAVVLLRREPDAGTALAGALVNLGAALRTSRPDTALAATDEAIARYERLVDLEPGHHEPNLDLARRNRALLTREPDGPYTPCDACQRRDGGPVAVRHRQVHVRVDDRESCVDSRLADVIRRLWTVCDTRGCCEDDGGRAYVVPATGQSALAEQVLLDLGFDVANEDGVLYFRLNGSATH